MTRARRASTWSDQRLRSSSASPAPSRTYHGRRAAMLPAHRLTWFRPSLARTAIAASSSTARRLPALPLELAHVPLLGDPLEASGDSALPACYSGDLQDVLQHGGGRNPGGDVFPRDDVATLLAELGSGTEEVAGLCDGARKVHVGQVARGVASVGGQGCCSDERDCNDDAPDHVTLSRKIREALAAYGNDRGSTSPPALRQCAVISCSVGRDLHTFVIAAGPNRCHQIGRPTAGMPPVSSEVKS
jgi:hypothetical protein